MEKCQSSLCLIQLVPRCFLTVDYFHQDDPNGFLIREQEETTRASLYHVAEHCPARSQSRQPHTERSSQPDSEMPSVQANVYVWRYALLVVHARKEEEETPSFDLTSQFSSTQAAVIT